MWDSCIYEGTVRHRRMGPKSHEFAYDLFMIYLDLAELPALFHDRWLWSSDGFAPAWFRRSDHFGDPSESLDQSVRSHVQRELGWKPEGSIRLLTNLRYWGYCFNPISLYYCFGPSGQQVEALIAEVHNTPWGEEHLYTIDARRQADATVGLPGIQKDFHVSPFLSMDLEYRFHFSPPGEQLCFHVDSFRKNQKIFDATLRLDRRPINGRNLTRTLLKHPFMTGKIIGAIYFEAFRLWWKGMPWHDHPGHRSVQEEKLP